MKTATPVLEQSTVDTEFLSLVGKKITKHLSVDLIAENLYQELNQLMDADMFGVGLYSEEENSLVFRGVYEKGKVLEEYQIGLNEDRIAIRCFKNREEIEIKDWKNTGYRGWIDTDGFLFLSFMQDELFNQNNQSWNH